MEDAIRVANPKSKYYAKEQMRVWTRLKYGVALKLLILADVDTRLQILTAVMKSWLHQSLLRWNLIENNKTQFTDVLREEMRAEICNWMYDDVTFFQMSWNRQPCV